MTTIHLIDGPMDGVEHEYEGLMPSAIGINLPENPESRIKHWYKVSDDEKSATFIKTAVLPW